MELLTIVLSSHREKKIYRQLEIEDEYLRTSLRPRRIFLMKWLCRISRYSHYCLVFTAKDFIKDRRLKQQVT